MICLDLGCGPVKREGFVGVDIRKTKASDVVCDILAGLPYEDDSVDAVFSSHFLEHIPLSKAPGLIVEIRRVLKPLGRLELVVPDYEWCANYSLSQLRNPDLARALLGESGDPNLAWTSVAWALAVVFGGCDNEYDVHKSGWTPDMLRSLLHVAGFEVFHLESRWDEVHTQRSLFVQAMKKGEG